MSLFERWEETVLPMILDEHEISEALELYFEEYEEDEGEEPSGYDGLIRQLMRSIVISKDINFQQIESLKVLLQERTKQRGAICPEGRITLTGVVLLKRDYIDTYGETSKVLIEHEEGWTAYGTLPKSMRSSTAVGDTISLRCTLVQAEDNISHAWIARPMRSAS